MTALEEAFGDGIVSESDFGWMVLTGFFYVTPEEMAHEFGVSVDTVNSWATGKIVPCREEQVLVRAYLLEEAPLRDPLVVP